MLCARMGVLSMALARPPVSCAEWAMTQSTIERAYALARTGRYATVAQLQRQLIEDGCRAVEPLLAPRSIRNHLQAICAAASAAAPQRKDP
jgi:hypothetical protein